MPIWDTPRVICCAEYDGKYGSVNLLSFGASQESVIRIVTGSVARTLFRSIGVQKQGSGNL